MYRAILKYMIMFVAFQFFLGCAKNINSDRTVVAEVGNERLYLDQVNEVIPAGMDSNDSTLMADDYVKKWVKKELMIKKAEENLTDEQKDLSQEIEDYKNSLIIYKYKNELIKQRMDTVVTDEQILEYYLDNPDNFNLLQNIVKAIFIKIPNEFANPQQLKDLCNDTSPEGLNELRDFCYQYAKGFDIFMDSWVNFDVVLKNIPKEVPDPEQFLTHNNLIEMKDADYYYLVSIQDYKLKNELAPIEYVHENIKNLLLNRRKIEFLKQMEDNVYTEGVRQNKFKIYNRETNETK